jgi:hypothetical protein
MAFTVFCVRFFFFFKPQKVDREETVLLLSVLLYFSGMETKHERSHFNNVGSYFSVSMKRIL